MSLTWTVGQKITAERLNRRQPVTASKPGNTSVTSDATVNADPDLVLTLKADTTYDLRGLLLVIDATDVAGDFRRGWSWTNTATITMGGAGGANNIASGTAGDGEWLAQAPDSTSPSSEITYHAVNALQSGVTVNDRIVVGSSDVTLTLTWAQAVSNGNATTLSAGSFVTATPVA